MLAASITRLRVACAFALAFGLCATPAASSATVSLPGKNRLETVDFERHIMGLFGRMGCNSGSCHGSFQGKGGFRLSLFGYDPEKDYAALTREMLGRRLNPVDPDRSLLLLKATGQTEHGGGRRFGRDSWQYQVFREWITGGTPWQKGSGTVAAITIHPPEYAFTKAGEIGQLKVRARFADGSEEDITPLCDYRINDDAVAEVTPLGQVKTLKAGDTAVVVSYRGNVLPVRVLVPMTPPPGFRYPPTPETSYIDREVFAKLRRLNIAPSELAGDAEFFRRVTIDTIGCLPSPDEVRSFLADKDPLKRAKKIDELLAHPMHAALWATKFCDITGNDTDSLEQPQQLRPKRSQMWHDWLRKRIAENMPYDAIVRGILCATSRDDRPPEEWLKQVKAMDEAIQKGFVTAYADRPSLDLFWRRQQNVGIEQWGEKTAAAFMGVRLECAQCHKHPFDRWTQADYRSYANIFGQVAFGISPESKKVIDAENAERRKQQTGKNNRQIIQVREIYAGGNARSLPHPDTNRPLPAKALGGPEIKAERGQDQRVVLFDWLRSPDNPFFARSFVNRVWGHYFGVGIVHPVDDFSLANPPSNEKLLDALAKDFVAHQYDIRRLERTILSARVYQLSSQTNVTNKLDRNNYSHSFIRPMMAEVVLDVLNSALGVTESFERSTEAPAGSRLIEVGSTRLQNAPLAYALRIFGRPPRTSACDCERALDPALPQTLYRMTDANLLAKLQASNGRLQQLLKSNKTDMEVLDELFLATLTRFPTEGEQKTFAAYRAASPEAGVTVKTDNVRRPAERTGKEISRQGAFTDALWCLINTTEFILNH